MKRLSSPILPALLPVFALLAMLLAAPAWTAPGVDIFVNNKPFKGASSGPPGDLMLEAGPYFALAGGDFVFDAATGQATLDGSPIPVTVVGQKVFVRAKEMVAQVGGKYSYNPDMKSVDIYAFDPVEAARKAWARIFALRSIDRPLDFQVMATLTRSILTKTGMDLDFPVELKLSTTEEIVAAGGSPNLTGYSTFHTLPNKTGIADATIYVKKGRSPLATINSLAFGWGAFYCQKIGLPNDMDLLAGVGLWAGYHVLEQLGARISADELGTNQTPGERARFQELMKTHEIGGAPAVMKHIRNLAKP